MAFGYLSGFGFIRCPKFLKFDAVAVVLQKAAVLADATFQASSCALAFPSESAADEEQTRCRQKTGLLSCSCSVSPVSSQARDLETSFDCVLCPVDDDLECSQGEERQCIAYQNGAPQSPLHQHFLSNRITSTLSLQKHEFIILMKSA